jgi:hypothetical protein
MYSEAVESQNTDIRLGAESKQYTITLSDVINPTHMYIVGTFVPDFAHSAHLSNIFQYVEMRFYKNTHIVEKTDQEVYMLTRHGYSLDIGKVKDNGWFCVDLSSSEGHFELITQFCKKNIERIIDCSKQRCESFSKVKITLTTCPLKHVEKTDEMEKTDNTEFKVFESFKVVYDYMNYSDDSLCRH